MFSRLLGYLAFFIPHEHKQTASWISKLAFDNAALKVFPFALHCAILKSNQNRYSPATSFIS